MTLEAGAELIATGTETAAEGTVLYVRHLKER
jgi:hypothetical protein